MKYLLDTNICVYWLKGNEHIEQSAIIAGLDNICISFITLSELFYGAYKSKRVDENLKVIRIFSDKLTVMESDYSICDCFGNLKTLLEKDGNIIDDADLFIAACALSKGATLVTNNEKHFKRVKNLNLQNWAGGI